MSLASYIGCNVEIPLSDEYNDLMYIGDCFSNVYNKRDVKKYQFTTIFVYEVSSDWGIEISEYMGQSTCAESKKKLIALCDIMDNYLEKGDYFQLYSCWVGEEKDKRVGEITLRIDHLNVRILYLVTKLREYTMNYFNEGECFVIFEIIAGLFNNIGQDNSLNTKKIDKHIEELRKYNWFNELYDHEKYHRLFFVNRRVRKFLQSTYRTKRLINNTNAQNHFISYLEKQISKIS